MREILSHIKNKALVATRRKQIMTAAMELFRKQGYHATTMRQISNESGVNRGSFYDYFGSKEDILVYIYKEMMYREGDFDKTFSKVEISGWKELEPYLRDVIFTSWKLNREVIQIMYRLGISLDKEMLRAVMKIESDYIRWVAENLRRGLNLPTVTREVEIMANTIVYIDAFLPLRGWNMKHLDQKDILDIILNMLMNQFKKWKRPEKRKK